MRNTINLSAFLLAVTVAPLAAQNDMFTGECHHQKNCASCHGANLERQP